MQQARMTMGAQGFLAAARRQGIQARLVDPNGVQVATVGPRGADGEADVTARELPGNECQIQATTLAGHLFLSVLAGGG